MNKGFDEGRSLSSLTIRDLFQVFDLYLERRAGNGNAILPAKAAPKRYVYGLDGIRDLFHCSHKQAQHYKDNVIREAVSQNGRKIVVDADYALELFNQRRTK